MKCALKILPLACDLGLMERIHLMPHHGLKPASYYTCFETMSALWFEGASIEDNMQGVRMDNDMYKAFDNRINDIHKV